MATPTDTPDRPPTAREKRFAEEFAVDCNRVRAYFRAFGRATPAGKPRSYKVAAESARRMLEKVGTQREIAAVRKELRRRSRVSALRVLRELALVAFADAGDLFAPDPAGGPDLPLPLSRVPPAARRALAAVKVKRRRLAGGGGEVYEVEEVEYRLADKLKALGKLCDHLGLTANGAALEDLLSRLREADDPAPARAG